MKKNAKILTLTLALAMLLCLAMGFASSAETTTAPDVVSKNVMVDGNFCLMFAVDPTTVAGEDVTLKIYDKAPAEGAEPIATITKAKTETELICLDDDKQLDDPAIVFYTSGVSAKDIADTWWYTAESSNIVSEVETYSVCEYALERLYGNNVIAATDDYGLKQKKFYLSILEVGANAQDLLVNTKLVEEGKSPERLANEYSYAAIFDGSFGDTTKKFVEIGDTLTLTANEGVPAWQVITYGTNGAVLDKESVTLGSTVTVAGNTVIIPDPTFGTTAGKYFEHIGDPAYSFDTTTNILGTGNLVTYTKLGSVNDSLSLPGYGYRILEEMEGHGKVVGAGKQLTTEQKPVIYMPVVDKANGNGNVLVFEADIQIRKAEMTYKDTEITNNVAKSTALFFIWQNADFNDLHGQWVANENKLITDGFQMVDTDAATLTNNKGGDGFTYFNSPNEIDLEMGKWYNITVEYYFDCQKAIYYINGEVVAAFNSSQFASLELLGNINSVGIEFMDRMRGSEVVFDNVFSAKIVKAYPAE